MTEGRVAASAGSEYGRFALWVLGISAGLCAVGYFPTRSLGGEGAVQAMIAAVSIAAAGSLIGGVPVFLARRKSSPQPHVVMASMLVRLLAVVALAAAAIWLSRWPGQAFLVWLVFAYLGLLVVDTRYAMTLLQSL